MISTSARYHLGLVMRTMSRLAVTPILIALLAPSLRAQEPEHPNGLALVLAGTDVKEREETFFTIGAEYEYRLGRRFGFGFAGEYVAGYDSFVLVAPIVFRPAKGLKLFVGPGLENASGELGPCAAQGFACAGAPRTTSFLLRFGAGYSFEFGRRYSITPAFKYDLLFEEAESRAFVFGVSFGVGF
jgi:hypothetical protein